MFLDYKGTTGTSASALTAGLGDEDYRLHSASPAKERVESAVLVFDLGGTMRSVTNDATGAYCVAAG